MQRSSQLELTNQHHLTLALNVLDQKLKILTLIKQNQYELSSTNLFGGMVITYDEVKALLWGAEKVAIEASDKVLMLETIKTLEADLVSFESQCLDQEVFLPLKYLEDVFQLNAFEKLCLIMALSVELNEKYKKIYAYLQDSVQAVTPTFQLAIELFQYELNDKFPLRFILKENVVLCQMLLVAQCDVGDRASGAMLLDESVLDFILGRKRTDTALFEYVTLISPNEESQKMNWNAYVLEVIDRFIGTEYSGEALPENEKKMIFISGEEGVGKTFQIEQWVNQTAIPAVVVDYLELVESEESIEIILHKILREIRLTNGVLCLDHFRYIKKSKRERTIIRILAQYCSFMFILSRDKMSHDLKLEGFKMLFIDMIHPDYKTRRDVWHYFANEKGLICETLSDVARAFQFSIGRIQSVVEKVSSINPSEQSEINVPVSVFFDICYSEIKHELGNKARKLKVRYTFNDLILPKEIMEELNSICARIRNTGIVFDEWGFGEKLSYGKGLSMVFSGEPGTGKTMAAHAIARELNLEIYQIDLSQMVSKYIGETEKNLSDIFNEAKRSNAILFFDEADALFGKRTAITNSNDKYANVETSFLLQKIEEYEGVTILSSNFLKNMDKAFMRRMNHIIEFHLPNCEQRLKIWEGIFPKEAPLCSTVDLNFLASHFDLSGGNIKNIALRAAFIAAERRDAITMKDLLFATKEELHKIGKVFVSDKLEEYADLMM